MIRVNEEIIKIHNIRDLLDMNDMCYMFDNGDPFHSYKLNLFVFDVLLKSYNINDHCIDGTSIHPINEIKTNRKRMKIEFGWVIKKINLISDNEEIIDTRHDIENIYALCKELCEI
jgi:hypothetical protein